MGHLWDALARVYDVLGFDRVASGDEVFRQLVLVRIIEPTSTLDSARVPEVLGAALYRERLTGREQVAAACCCSASPWSPPADAHHRAISNIHGAAQPAADTCAVQECRRMRAFSTAVCGYGYDSPVTKQRETSPPRSI